MVESASKGAVLLWSKELIKDSALSLGIGYKPTPLALRVKYVKNILSLGPPWPDFWREREGVSARLQ